MINVSFCLRNPKDQKEQSIVIRFSYNKKQHKLISGQYVAQKDWLFVNQRYKSTYRNSALANKLLKEKKDFIEEYIEELNYQKRRFYIEDLVRDFNSKFKFGVLKKSDDNQINDFISFIDYELENKKELKAATRTSLIQTRKNLMLAMGLIGPKELKANPHSNFEDFVPAKPIEWDELNNQNFKFVNKFKSYLMEATYPEKKDGVFVEVPYSKNYVAKSVKNLKQFMNSASIYGYIRDLSYKSIKMEWEEADTIYTPWEEIDMIKTVDLSEENEAVRFTRDLYVFNCYCGLRYSDLSKLKKYDFVKKADGWYLKINRTTKTDQQLYFPILPEAEKILQKYNFELPKIADATFNRLIKKVCLLAGLNTLEKIRQTRGGEAEVSAIPRWKLVASHTGRRSFATNFDEDGVPLKEIMSITGHTTEKALRTYIKKKEETAFTGFKNAGSFR